MITAANMNQAYGGQVPLSNTGAEDQRMYAGGTPGFNGNFGVISPTATQARVGADGSGGNLQAAWDGQFWDQSKLDAGIASQLALDPNNKIAHDETWMQALNPLSGIKLDQAGRAGYTQYGDTDYEVAATQNTYKDALGRSYSTVAGAEGDPSQYIQFNDSSGSGWRNPTGSDKDRVNPIYKLNADGTATPHSANSNYRAGSWNRHGQEIATWAAIMGTAGMAGPYIGGGTAGTEMAGATLATDATGATVSSGAAGGGYGGAGAAWTPTATSAAGTTAGGTAATKTATSQIPAWMANAGKGALVSGASTALQGGSGSQILNSAVGGAVGGGTGTNLGGAVTGALNGNGGSGGGQGGGGGGSGGSGWEQFINGLTGGSGGSGGTDWGSLLNTLGTGYAAYEAGKKADNAYTNQINSINGLYAPDSAYAKQMEQTLARKDAAAGRNSQYGTRAVELAANLTDSKSKAINSANYTNLMAGKINAQNQFPASLVSLMQGKGGQGAAGLVGQGVNAGYNWLADLYRGYTGGGTTGQTADPNIGPQMPVDNGTANPNIGPQYEPGFQGDPDFYNSGGFYDDYGNWIEG